MLLRYQRAIVSFCPDLRKPGLQSVPLAILLVGESDDGRFAGVASCLPASLKKSLDPISLEMLQDVPHMLRRHVDETMSSIEEENAPLDTILRKLHQALRNSLHVSSIEQPATQAMGEDGNIYPVIAQLLTEALNDLGVPASIDPDQLDPKARERRALAPEMTVWPMARQSYDLHA